MDFIEGANELVAMDPAYMRAHYVRADCALWMGHEKADEYLQEFEQVLPPYNAGDCANEAYWMVQAAPEVRDRLLPLALLLSRKAVEKEPDNPDFLTTRGEALYHAQNWQDAESALLTAYSLTNAGSGPRHPATDRVVRLLVQLYESGGKPDEAARWRAKLAEGV
jgi:tetratricopeptide (TPR) repeat protein